MNQNKYVINTTSVWFKDVFDYSIRADDLERVFCYILGIGLQLAGAQLGIKLNVGTICGEASGGRLRARPAAGPGQSPGRGFKGQSPPTENDFKRKQMYKW